MNGAREYSMIFSTGQRGRLYFVSASHARGKTFRIFVLPEDEAAIPNGNSNAPLNVDGVEVYGVVSGNPGWSESYGWLHLGPWQDDFGAMVRAKLAEIVESQIADRVAAMDQIDANKKRIASLLSRY